MTFNSLKSEIERETSICLGDWNAHCPIGRDELRAVVYDAMIRGASLAIDGSLEEFKSALAQLARKDRN